MARTGKTVLVVEDEPLILFAAADHLRDQGLDVVEAFNADQALAILNTNPSVDVVVTDVNMPGTMDGLELSRTVQQKWPQVGVIVTSGKPVKALVPKGAIFFSKPYRLESLSKAIQEMQI